MPTFESTDPFFWLAAAWVPVGPGRSALQSVWFSLVSRGVEVGIEWHDCITFSGVQKNSPRNLGFWDPTKWAPDPVISKVM